MKNSTKISIVFWLHFIVAAASHIFVVLMIGGILKLLLSTGPMDFWVKGLLLGVTFYTGMYGVNHVTNSDGFCVLTDLENFYRKKENKPLVGPYTPRFYKQSRKILGAIQRLFSKRPKEGQ